MRHADPSAFAADRGLGHLTQTQRQALLDDVMRLLCTYRLPPGAPTVAWALLFAMNWATGLAWPGSEQLCARLGMNKRTLARCLTALVELGVFRRELGRVGRNSTYWLDPGWIGHAARAAPARYGRPRCQPRMDHLLDHGLGHLEPGEFLALQERTFWAVAGDRDLCRRHPRAPAVAMAIVRRINSKTGLAWPSMTDLLDDIEQGMARNTLARCISALVERGYLGREIGVGDQVSVYWICPQGPPTSVTLVEAGSPHQCHPSPPTSVTPTFY